MLYEEKDESRETISQDQENKLKCVIGENEDIVNQILDTLSIKALTEIPKSEYYLIKLQAQRIVEYRDGKVKDT